jgi:paraquat-inducible protein B
MLREHPSALERDELPEVEVKKRRGISLVWLIPLVTGAIALWLTHHAAGEGADDHVPLTTPRPGAGKTW